MNTSNTNPRSRASVAFVLASLLGSASSLGCIIDAKIGDDPLSDGGETTQGETEQPPPEESSTTAFPGYTSGSEPGTASATTTGGNPGTASATSQGDASATATATATSAGDTEGGVDQDTALEQCGVVVVPPEAGDPVYEEGIMCGDGCLIFVESAEPTNLYEQGECVCEAMACGPLAGGTSGGPGGSDGGDTDSGGEPDGCGPFPPGDGGFTCVCEMCSIDVTNVDAAWVEGGADLGAICECMCGGAGCGAPA